MIDEINLYYGYMLDIIELLIAFYFAIEAVSKKPMFGMFERENYDYDRYGFGLLPHFAIIME